MTKALAPHNLGQCYNLPSWDKHCFTITEGQWVDKSNQNVQSKHFFRSWCDCWNRKGHMYRAVKFSDGKKLMQSQEEPLNKSLSGRERALIPIVGSRPTMGKLEFWIQEVQHCWSECLSYTLQSFVFFFSGKQTSKRSLHSIRLNPLTEGFKVASFTHWATTAPRCMSPCECMCYFFCYWSSKWNFGHCWIWTTNLRMQSQLSYTLSWLWWED